MALKLIPAAETVPEASLMVMTPAAPPLPMEAVSPLTQVKSVTPSDQLALVVVFQLPVPSLGTPGLTGLASQVRVCPSDGLTHSAADAAAARICAPTRRRFVRLITLHMCHTPSRACRKRSALKRLIALGFQIGTGCPKVRPPVLLT